MSLKQIVVKSATAMSLHERFTKIRKTKEASTSGERVMQQLASGRNRRLAQQMERRPSVAAALRRESIKTRLGTPGAISVRERLRLPRGFSARRGRGSLAGKSPLTRGLSRGLGVTENAILAAQRRSRARSPFVANKVARRRSRSRSRSRLPFRSRSRSRARSQSNSRFRSRSKSRSRYPEAGTSPRGLYSGRRRGYGRGRGGSLRNTSKNDLRSYRPKLGGGFRSNIGNNTGRKRGRGSFRTRSRGRGRGRGADVGRGRGNSFGRGRLPTKEELDRELDQYMSIKYTLRPYFHLIKPCTGPSLPCHLSALMITDCKAPGFEAMQLEYTSQ